MGAVCLLTNLYPVTLFCPDNVAAYTCIIQVHLRLDFFMEENNMNPDQTIWIQNVHPLWLQMVVSRWQKSKLARRVNIDWYIIRLNNPAWQIIKMFFVALIHPSQQFDSHIITISCFPQGCTSTKQRIKYMYSTQGHCTQWIAMSSLVFDLNFEKNTANKV